MSLSEVVDNTQLSGNEQVVLNLVADFQLKEAQPSPIEHVLLARPQELAESLKSSVVSLVEKDCLELSGLEPRHLLHLTPTGLVLCARTGDATRFAEHLLAFFKKRLQNEGVKFRTFTWEELRKDGVAQRDEDWALALVTIQVLDLYSDSASSSPGPPAQAAWGVPSDIVYLRDLTDIAGLYDRAEERRKRRNQMFRGDLTRRSPRQPGSGELRRGTGTAMSSRWTRLRTAVTGAAAVIEREPRHLASMKPSADRARELLSGPPSVQAIEELEYLLGRIEQFVARWRPSPRPTPGVFYKPPPWARDTDTEVQEALRILGDIRAHDEPQMRRTAEGEEAMKIFVSHSSADPARRGCVCGLLASCPSAVAEGHTVYQR